MKKLKTVLAVLMVSALAYFGYDKFFATEEAVVETSDSLSVDSTYVDTLAMVKVDTAKTDTAK